MVITAKEPQTHRLREKGFEVTYGSLVLIEACRLYRSMIALPKKCQNVVSFEVSSDVPDVSIAQARAEFRLRGKCRTDR